MSSQINKKIKVGIIGLGMVGEPIRRWFEEYKGYRRGQELFCYDADPRKGYGDDINRADMIFIAVPTPTKPDGSCDISIVQRAVAGVKDGKTIIIKSTVTPGTGEILQKKYPRKKFIFNPEFLTEARAWLDYLKPDRQIVGHTAKSHGEAEKVMALLPTANFKRPHLRDGSSQRINTTEAELAKYGSNVFGYIKVVYGNILADIAHAITVNFKNKKIDTAVSYNNVREAIASDPRIGPAWLNVEHGDYCGAGGYCFPKDMNALISFAEDLAGNLSGNKNKTNSGLVPSLKKGISVLKAIADYNNALLDWQGLTMADVSRHDKDVVVKKGKKIRQN